MNAAEIRNYVKIAAGESADQQVEDFDEDFIPMNDTDEELITIMSNSKIRDKVGAFADVLWNNKGFLMDHLGDKVYEIDSNEGRFKLLESLSKVSTPSHHAWNEVLIKIEKELIER